MSRKSGGRPPTLPALWSKLAEAAGSVELLAQELGVSRRTVHRWAHGERTPSLLEQRAINAWAKAKRVAVVPFPAAAAA
jgi:transcriptional regulator with XRE-family HTH domain